MHHHGGGYTDIKMTKTDWSPYFDSMDSTGYWANGYTEIPGGSASSNSNITQNYKQLIGNCSYIFRPGTLLTASWIDALHKKLDQKLQQVIENPPQGARDCTGSTEYSSTPSTYPFRWAELLGEHFHDIMYPYQDRILHELPKSTQPITYSILYI